MRATVTSEIHELLVVPFDVLLSETARAVAEAQAVLDETSMRVQEQLDILTDQAIADADGDPSGLARFQVDATWYHIPEVDIEMKMAVSMELKQETRTDGRSVFTPRLRSIPYNSKVKNLTNLDAEGTSRVSAKIVSVPPAERAALEAG